MYSQLTIFKIRIMKKIYVTNKYFYVIILSIESISCIFIVHFYNGIVILQPELEKNIISNFIFQIILFSGITEIATKINYFKDVK